MFSACSSCGSSHLPPVPCGLTFRDRLASVQVDKGRFDTAEKRNYFDQQLVDETFGPDASERMMEDTKGLGYARTTSDGIYHRDRKSGDVVRVGADELDRVYLGGDSERDFNPDTDY